MDPSRTVHLIIPSQELSHKASEPTAKITRDWVKPWRKNPSTDLHRPTEGSMRVKVKSYSDRLPSVIDR